MHRRLESGEVPARTQHALRDACNYMLLVIIWPRGRAVGGTKTFTPHPHPPPLLHLWGENAPPPSCLKTFAVLPTTGLPLTDQEMESLEATGTRMTALRGQARGL